MKKISVNLTTTHNRVALCLISVISIINQNRKPDKINIWISQDAYLNDGGISEVPDILEKINNIEPIVEIKYVENSGPYRKIMPPLQLISDEFLIVTADDDIVYGPDWLSSLIDTYSKNPRMICAARVREIKKSIFGIGVSSYINWPIVYTDKIFDDGYIVTTGGGVLIDGDLIDKNILLDKNYLHYAPTADDIWVSHILKHCGLKIATSSLAAKNLIFLKHEFGLEKINLKSRFGGLFYGAVRKILGKFGFSMCNNDVVYRKLTRYFK